MQRTIASLAAVLMMTASTTAFAQDAAQPAPAAPTPAASDTAIATPAPVDAAPAAQPAPAPVAAQVSANEPYQVLRATDRDMSCADIATESNQLNAWLLARHDAVVQKANNAKVASGLMRSAGRFGLSRFGGGLGAMGAKALDTANNVAADAVAQNGQPTNLVTPQQQRMNHLLEIYKAKNC